jgi:hypothetical protein
LGGLSNSNHELTQDNRIGDCPREAFVPIDQPKPNLFMTSRRAFISRIRAFKEGIGSDSFRHRLLYSRYLPKPATLGLILLLFFIGCVISIIASGWREGNQTRDRRHAVMNDVRMISKQLRVLEKSKGEIEISDLKQTVALSSGTRWEDIWIYPFASDDSPLVVYRGPMLDSYVLSFRSGGIFTTQDAPKQLGDMKH